MRERESLWTARRTRSKLRSKRVNQPVAPPAEENDDTEVMDGVARGEGAAAAGGGEGELVVAVLVGLGEHGALDPVHAGLLGVLEGDGDNDGLDDDLGELDVHVGDDVSDGLDVGGRGHDDDGVGALVGEDFDVVLVELAEAALLFGFGRGRVAAAGAVGGVGERRRAALVAVAVGDGALGVERLVLAGGAVADQVVEHGGDVLGDGVFEAHHLDDDVGGGLDFDVEDVDDAVEEGHVLGARDEDEDVGALVGDDLDFAADDAALGVGDEGFDNLVSLGRGLLGGSRGARAGAYDAGGRGRVAALEAGGAVLPGLHRRLVLLLLLLLERLGDDLLQALLDVGRLGELDRAHVGLLAVLDGDVDVFENLHHAVDVVCAVGDEDRVGALEELDLALPALEALDRLLGLLD